MMRPVRQRACHDLHGRVLELGFGSGLNCDLYPGDVTEVLAVEPSDAAWDLSAPRRDGSGAPVHRVGLDGARVDLPDACVESVLVTFSLCTIPDVDAALDEARRLLVPGGTLHLAEHGLSPDARVATWQRRLDGLQQRLFGGCHLTRDPAALLTAAGFGDHDLRQEYLSVPAIGRPWAWVTSGSAAVV
ncbi:class I SAM-dependent methyltransferase [Aeromicrobium sp. CTD01-1L150]|uniref:class I SAM-dependent methyltransferase n=1 Tax=Aeromicrobium sp. CTD01-1L150 TaxID=3341830 RepID=UPI0035BFFE8E